MSKVILRLRVRRPRLPRPRRRPLFRRRRLSAQTRRHLAILARRSGERVYFTVLTSAAGLAFRALLRRWGGPKEHTDE